MTDPGPTHHPALSFRATGATHAGSFHSYNEDRFVNRTDLGLWAVADGVGGHGGGEVAAELVASRLECLAPRLPLAVRRAHVVAALQSAHAELLARSQAGREPGSPATTVVALLADQGRFVCLWVGDSRAYRLRGGRLHQITRDHSLVQELVDMGAIQHGHARNHPRAGILTRAVGHGSVVDLDQAEGELQPGDRMLLCSDGLHTVLEESRIAEILAQDGDVAEALLQAALALNAADNVTAIAIITSQALPAAAPALRIPEEDQERG